MTEITQADREAAARAWAEDNDEPLDCYICEQIRAGYGDNSLDVIRFARHRMEERAAIVAWLHEQHDIYNPSDNWSAYWAEKIEAGEHLK